MAILMEFHNANKVPCDIGNIDWVRNGELVSLLKCFHKSTKRLSGVIISPFH